MHHMRNALLSLTTLFAVVAPILGQTVVEQSQPNWATKLFPEFKDGQLAKDFGNVPHGTLLQHRFKLHNIYAVPLKITTRVGCSCLTATPSVEVIQPEKDAII